MTLQNEYKKQFPWRPWAVIFDALPDLAGSTVLDLGCGVGDQAALLAARGAKVIGFDTNESLLYEARSRQIPRAEFINCDLRHLNLEPASVDGLWCSFASAYFPDLTSVLEVWKRSLRPGAWVAFTDIDDLFAHEPLSLGSRLLFERYIDEALVAGRYDFRMGRKLQQHLVQAGFEVTRVLTPSDAEFSFDGPALPDVVEAWSNRFERLTPLRDLCGSGFNHLKSEFLAMLSHPEHRSEARVYCVIGSKKT